MAGAACQVRPGRRRAQRRSQHTHTAASASHLDTPLGPCPCPCPCRGRGSRGRGRGGCGRGGGPCRPSRAPSLPLAASRHARGRAAAAQPRAASRHRRHRHLHQVAEVGEEGRRPSRHTPALCDITATSVASSVAREPIKQAQATETVESETGESGTRIKVSLALPSSISCRPAAPAGCSFWNRRGYEEAAVQCAANQPAGWFIRPTAKPERL